MPPLSSNVSKISEASSAPLAGIGRTLGATIARQNSLPDDVIKLTRLFILDSLGLVVGGGRAPGIQQFAQALRDLEPSGGRATTLIDGRVAAPVTAAMINSAAAHALDFDDTHDAARVHVFSVVLPAVIAAAEMAEDISNQEFVLAAAIGAEVFCRLGLACPDSLATGWHPTATFGALAAAAACSKVFKLDAAKTTNALAIAFVQMSGTGQSILDGALTKRLGAGFAARNGLTAACLARAGLTGPQRYLEGAAGLFELYERGKVQPSLLTAGFGERWELRELSMKPFPCCRCTHSLIQIGIELHNAGLRVEDVREGELFLGKLNYDYVGGSFEPETTNPVVHAQFNANYVFSQALRDGKVDCETFVAERVLSPESRIAEKFRTAVSPSIEAGAMAPAHVKIALKNGEVKSVEKSTMKGSPEEPLSEAEVLAKFRANLKWGAGVEHEPANRLGRQLLELSGTAKVTEFVRAFSSECAASR